MTAEAELFKYNLIDEMRELERLCERPGDRELNDLHVIFKNVDDGLFAFIASGSFVGFEAVKAVLPGWASDEIRQDSTGGFSFREHVLDASWFWRTVRDEFERIADMPIGRAIVADYGAGWGRISRFINKDVAAKQFYALEPNPVFQNIYRECRLPGHLVPTDWQSAIPTSVKSVDLVICYSILTHSSESLTKNIVDRWVEMTKPGSVVAFTIRPGFYLGERDGDMSVFTQDQHSKLQEEYSSGEFIYRAYSGDVDWGVTIIPTSWLENLFKDRFEIVKYSFQLQTSNQMIVFARRI